MEKTKLVDRSPLFSLTGPPIFKAEKQIVCESSQEKVVLHTRKAKEKTKTHGGPLWALSPFTSPCRPPRHLFATGAAPVESPPARFLSPRARTRGPSSGSRTTRVQPSWRRRYRRGKPPVGLQKPEQASRQAREQGRDKRWERRAEGLRAAVTTMKEDLVRNRTLRDVDEGERKTRRHARTTSGIIKGVTAKKR